MQFGKTRRKKNDEGGNQAQGPHPRVPRPIQQRGVPLSAILSISHAHVLRSSLQVPRPAGSNKNQRPSSKISYPRPVALSVVASSLLRLAGFNPELLSCHRSVTFHLWSFCIRAAGEEKKKKGTSRKNPPPTFNLELTVSLLSPPLSYLLLLGLHASALS